MIHLPLARILFAVAALFVAHRVTAAPAEVEFRQVRIGQAVVSLSPGWTTPGAEVPVWLHLHGAATLVEKNFAAIRAPGVLINVTLPGLSKVYADYFAAPDRWEHLLRETESLLRRESAAQRWRIGALTVSSFSAGFGGVRQLLRQPAAFERIATLVMADSIYCGYAGDPADKRVDPELMAGFLRFARLAAEGRKRLLISHSAQVPEGYASTTETADYLIHQLGGVRVDRNEVWKGGLTLQSRFSDHGCEILGFAGDGPEDHLRHLRALGLFLQRAQP